jgi:hypothetical protein
MSPPIATSDLDSEMSGRGVDCSSASTAYAGDGRSNGLYTNSIHSNETTPGVEPIAICGMALRLPGGLHTPQQFWDFLVAKGDARGRVPEVYIFSANSFSMGAMLSRDSVVQIQH